MRGAHARSARMALALALASPCALLVDPTHLGVLRLQLHLRRQRDVVEGEGAHALQRELDGAPRPARHLQQHAVLAAGLALGERRGHRRPGLHHAEGAAALHRLPRVGKALVLVAPHHQVEEPCQVALAHAVLGRRRVRHAVLVQHEDVEPVGLRGGGGGRGAHPAAGGRGWGAGVSAEVGCAVDHPSERHGTARHRRVLRTTRRCWAC
jgi:hypothetical protein